MNGKRRPCALSYRQPAVGLSAWGLQHPGCTLPWDNLLTPLVSILIPANQSAAVLAETLDSALAQTWPNIEIIVIDDGSSDGTAAIAGRYVDRGVICRSQSQRGACRARNHAYRLSRGEYIQFLDSDDLLAPDKISLQMRRLLEAPPGSMATGPWAHFSDDIGKAQPRPEPLWVDQAPLDWLISARGGGGMMPTGCWLTPRAVIDAAGPWDESLPGNPDDDGEFFSRVVMRSSGVLFCPEALFYYRMPDGNNLRQQRSPESVASLLETMHRYERRLLRGADNRETRRAAAYGYAHFLWMIHPSYPDQCRQASAALEQLHSDHPLPGSIRFRLLANCLGFQGALAFRSRVRALATNNSESGS